jgi:hypothetical protein
MRSARERTGVIAQQRDPAVAIEHERVLVAVAGSSSAAVCLACVPAVLRSSA